MSDSTKQLGQLLDEAKMQVTFTGWKAELEATENKLSELQAKYDELKSKSEKLIEALTRINYNNYRGIDQSIELRNIAAEAIAEYRDEK